MPSGASSRYCAPRLEVMTEKEEWSDREFSQEMSLNALMTVFLKDTTLPCESVRRPSSKTCRNKVVNSRAAFSISSIKTIEYGRRRTHSVSWPPSSCPVKTSSNVSICSR